MINVQGWLKEQSAIVGKLSFNLAETRRKVEEAEEAIEQLTAQVEAYRSDEGSLKKRLASERSKLELLQFMAQEEEEVRTRKNGSSELAEDFEGLMTGSEKGNA